MKLRQLFENIYEEQPGEFDGGLKTIGVCFGRFNPPHKGHKAVWQAAAQNPIWYIGTNQSTSGPKDPLPYDVKLQAMAAVWPKVVGHVIPEQSLLTLASRIYQEHGSNVHLKVYTDEEWLIKALQQYNGVEKEHGMYKFNQIDWAKTQRLASATNLRAAVRAGDREAFYKDMGIKPSVTIDVGGKEYPVFDVVAHFLNKFPEKVKKAVAESFDAAEFHRHMEKLRAREELRKTDPMRALVGDMIDKDNAARKPVKKQDDDSMSINDPRHPGWSYTELGHQHHNVDEAEGEPEGVPHLTKTVLRHIVQQVGTEGAHAIIKSLEWGDGAAKELLQLIVKDLKQNLSMSEDVKQRLDAHCWKGKHKEGTKIKGGVRVNNCVANEGEVVKFPKKHRGDISDMHSCPKCGGDLQGGKYMGHEVQVCIPCKQVYLPPNSGIDQKGNKIQDEGLGDVVKGVKRKIAGKEDPEAVVQRRYMDYVSKRMTGDPHHKAGKRYDKVDQVVRKRDPDWQTKALGLDEIAGAFPSPSTREKWAKDAAASNAAEAKRQAALKAQADAQRLATNTPAVDRLNKVNYSGANAPKPSNATWDGDSSFLTIDGTQYARASRMPIPGGEAPDMKLIATQEGWQVYVWTRNSLKGVVGRYFYPAEKPNTIQENNTMTTKADPRMRMHMIKKLIKAHGWELSDLELATNAEIQHEYNKLPEIKALTKKLNISEVALPMVAEATKHGKIPKHMDDASQGTFRMRDVGGYDRTYHLNRIMMATAIADGKSKKPVDMDSSSFVEKYNVAFPYTDEEQMMMFQAMSTIPTDGKELSKRGKSQEPKDTNTVSTTAKPKKNKYGI